MEIGIDSFASGISLNGKINTNSSQVIEELLERIEHADKQRLHVFGIGEHHRKEFLDSAPSIILAAAAGRTKQIRLTSAVTVLSAADPVRVFQQYATLDLVSNGRAEIVAGRGSFTSAPNAQESECRVDGQPNTSMLLVLVCVVFYSHLPCGRRKTPAPTFFFSLWDGYEKEIMRVPGEGDCHPYLDSPHFHPMPAIQQHLPSTMVPLRFIK